MSTVSILPGCIRTRVLTLPLGNAIAQAKLDGLEKDLKMDGNEFNTTVSILFVGYVLMQVGSTALSHSDCLVTKYG